MYRKNNREKNEHGVVFHDFSENMDSGFDGNFEPLRKVRFLKISLAPTQREADFLRLPFGIKGKKSQDKKNRAFWSGLN